MNENLFCGDSQKILRDLPENSIDSIVTDPPYGLSFMGKRWDYDVPSVDIWKECLRVLKPGGHLLAFGGTRTYHRLVVAIEDAGFEIRDQIQWIYGQGFPKSQDISKAIDKAAGAEREILGRHPNAASSLGNGINMDGGKAQDEVYITAPATPDAQKWSGWGTALKPANEPICLARKPLSESTITKNVLKWGTGGLNIDGSRIENNGKSTARPLGKSAYQTQSGSGVVSGGKYGTIELKHEIGGGHEGGRFPANVIFDEAAAEVLDEQTGVLKSGALKAGHKQGGSNMYDNNKGANVIAKDYGGDSGGASRFFYIAKASKSDRGEGNTHPTVKPIKLMEYLIKLVTPPGGKVLDPFMGSGTTGLAAKNLGADFIGIELQPEYFQISMGRLG